MSPCNKCGGTTIERWPQTRGCDRLDVNGEPNFIDRYRCLTCHAVGWVDLVITSIEWSE